MAPCKSTAEEVSFKWSHYKISSIDAKVRTTLYMSPKLSLKMKGLIDENSASELQIKRDRERGLLSLICDYLSYYNKAQTGNLWIVTRLLIFVPVDRITSFARGFGLKLGGS